MISNITSRHYLSVFPLILILFISRIAQGEIMGTTSIEWRAIDASVVAVGKVIKHGTERGPGDVLYEDVVLEISENIKGASDKQLAFTFRHVDGHLKPWTPPEGELLVFLSVAKDYKDFNNPTLYIAPDERRMHKKLVPHPGGYDHPTGYSVISLVEPLKDLFDRDQRSVTDRDELLKICRTWVKSGVVHPLQISVEWGPVMQRYYAGSAVYFMVPAEEKFRERYLKYAGSTDERERSQAAQNLWKYPGDKTEAALRELLKDESHSFWLSGPPYTIKEVEYNIRRDAYHGLKQLGKSVPDDIVIKRPPTPAEQAEYRAKNPSTEKK
jgi:hypothetical protein